jgi:hypothetical protein
MTEKSVMLSLQRNKRMIGVSLFDKHMKQSKSAEKNVLNNQNNGKCKEHCHS